MGLPSRKVAAKLFADAISDAWATCCKIDIEGYESCLFDMPVISKAGDSL